MTQKQTVYGQCDPGVDSKPDVDCEYIGPWNKTTGDTCPDDGYHRFLRTTINSSKSTSKSEECEYIGEWRKTDECAADWWSDIVEGKQWYERDTVNSEKTTRESNDCKVVQEVKACYGGEKFNPAPRVCSMVWRNKPNPNKCISRPGGGCSHPPSCYATNESRIQDRTPCPEKTLCKDSAGNWGDCVPPDP